MNSVPVRNIHLTYLLGTALYHFVQMRLVFSSVLRVSDSPISTNQYMCLIAMSATLILWGTVLTSIAIWANTSRGLQPWTSWEHVHSEWSHVDVYIWTSMSPRSRSLALLSWWTIPVSSVIFFIFLGFGEDALSEYRRAGNAIIGTVRPGALPEREEKPKKGTPLASSFPDFRFAFFLMSQYNPTHLFQRSSFKKLSPYFPNSPHAPSPTVTTRVAERTSKLREPVLPLPILTKTETKLKPRLASKVSTSDSLGSLQPLMPATRSGTVDSTFYFHPTASMSNHSEITRFSISDNHLASGQIHGPFTPPSIKTPAMNQQETFQGLPQLQPLRPLDSLLGFSNSNARLQPPTKLNARRWSARSEKLRPPPLRLNLAKDRSRECASGVRTVIVAEPLEAHMRESVR